MGIDYKDIAETLEREGVEKFADSFDELIEVVRAEARLARRRLERPTSSTASGRATHPVDGRRRGRRLGWLEAPGRMRERVPEILSSGPRASEAGSIRRAARDGRLVARARGPSPAFGVDRFHVLDTTHPAAIRALESTLDLEDTLFISSSKSGSTLETRSHTDYFWEPGGTRDARSWRSPTLARRSPASHGERALHRAFHREPTSAAAIGALLFGLVPAALMGIDLVSAAVERAE